MHRVSVQNVQVLAGQSTLVCPCVGVHKRTLLMRLSLLYWQYPACLLCPTWIVWEMGSKWPFFLWDAATMICSVPI